MKKTDKKIIVLISVIAAFAVIIAITAAVTAKESSVTFTDSSGNELGIATYDGKSIKISTAEEGYYDYISLALEEAIGFYALQKENSDAEPTRLFFKEVARAETSFSAFYYEKIKNGFADTELEDDTPFASVIVDGNGRVLAAYGYTAEDSTAYSLNKTYAGSSIKPLSVYAPAIEKGIIHWSSPVEDSPVKKVTYLDKGEQDWPQNANGVYTYEDKLVCDAVYRSTNTVAVKALQALGVKNSMSFLEKLNLGLDSEKKLIESSPEDEIYGNLALGFLIDGVSPLDMAGYYQIFINGGKYTEPWAVRSVTDRDGKLINKTPKSKKVLSTAAASIMAKLLQGVVQPGGTGAEANVDGISIGGKTGTSDGNLDNWFIGFSTKVVCSVWHGYNNNSKNSSHAIFHSIFSQLPKTNEIFRISKDVRTRFYCKKSGGIRGPRCSDADVGYYLSGSIPEACNQCG